MYFGGLISTILILVAFFVAMSARRRTIDIKDRLRRAEDKLDTIASEIRWMREERGVCFLVGGPDGLAEECRERAHDVWALGRLTLPHPMVRAILAEQLYRAWSVTQNHPYHRE